MLGILLQTVFFFVLGYVINMINLRQKPDMNMKLFVVYYLFFWGISRFFLKMIAFTIEQGSREVNRVHGLFFIAL